MPQYKPVGKPSKEIVYHVSSLDPDKHSAEVFANIIRGHWQVEVYHNKRDCGYHEDLLTRRGNNHLIASMLIARTFGMWICSRNPNKTTNEVKQHLNLNPNELVEIVTKGGLK